MQPVMLPLLLATPLPLLVMPLPPQPVTPLLL
jgi:hypothetical protein